jgi:chaperonin GroEL
MVVSLDDPYILLHEKKISNMREMIRSLKRSLSQGGIFIIAEDFEGEHLPHSL